MYYIHWGQTIKVLLRVFACPSWREREERRERTSKSEEVSSQRKLGKKSTAEKLKVPMLSALCMLSRDIKNAESTACTYIVSISVVTYTRKKKKKKEGNCRQQFRCKFEGFSRFLMRTNDTHEKKLHFLSPSLRRSRLGSAERSFVCALNFRRRLPAVNVKSFVRA